MCGVATGRHSYVRCSVPMGGKILRLFRKAPALHQPSTQFANLECRTPELSSRLASVSYHFVVPFSSISSPQSTIPLHIMVKVSLSRGMAIAFEHRGGLQQRTRGYV